MKPNKYKNSKINLTTNLLGETNHRNFLKIQASYGFDQRGGSQFPYSNLQNVTLLVRDIHILTSTEKQQLIFSEFIFTN